MKNELFSIGLGIARSTAEFVLFLVFVLFAFKTLMFPTRPTSGRTSD